VPELRHYQRMLMTGFACFGWSRRRSRKTPGEQGERGEA